MKLSIFITTHAEEILREWEAFATTMEPLKDANKTELRDHAAELLKVIALDLDTPQSDLESIAKSKGQGPREAEDTIAENHAAHRIGAGFSTEEVMAEFRALRSSVLRLWAKSIDITTPEEIQDMVRFNEAIDQAQSESMARYTQMLKEAQNLFLSILGHDVRTPLGAISMGSQVLLHDPSLPAKALKIGLRIFNSSVRMDEIIRDLLDFSTTHLGGGIPIDVHNVDLLDICQNVVEEARMFHPDRKIYLTTDGHLVGAWDGPRIAQAFSNLISNAVQHGQPQGDIKISIHGHPDEVLYTVQNDAEVIPAAKLRTLFDPVKRFAVRPAVERKGTRTQNLGLGLYVVKEIAAAHGGTISVTSTEQDGVTIIMSLPRIEPHRRSDDISEE
jgi:signal transduction histidine kinase